MLVNGFGERGGNEGEEERAGTFAGGNILAGLKQPLKHLTPAVSNVKLPDTIFPQH